jgi:hypothetical protein
LDTTVFIFWLLSALHVLDYALVVIDYFLPDTLKWFQTLVARCSGRFPLLVTPVPVPLRHSNFFILGGNLKISGFKKKYVIIILILTIYIELDSFCVCEFSVLIF